MKLKNLCRSFIAVFAVVGCVFTLAAFVSPARAADENPRLIRVLIWDEQQPEQKQVYANYIGGELAAYLSKLPGLSVRNTHLDSANQGITPDMLDNCDVLIWWGHKRHREVKPETGREIVQRIKEGKLSLLALHSGHWSTPFVEAMAERAREDAISNLPPEERATARITTIPAVLNALPTLDSQLTPNVTYVKKPGEPVEATLKLPSCVFPFVRADGKPSEIITLLPDHPIAQGIPHRFVLPQTEMYGEPFNVPQPDAVVFEEHFQSGNWFRSGSVWNVGKGKVFYFRPGHEIYPIFKNPIVLRILENAVRWLGQKS
jgi:trehalose utilization protein